MWNEKLNVFEVKISLERL